MKLLQRLLYLNYMEEKYFITKEQLNFIEHYKRMFELEADNIKGLCSSEKDDIVYGFVLGETHSHLRQCFIDMMELYNEIKEQKI